MRVLAPTLSLEPGRAVVTARFESDDQRFAATDVRLWAPRRLAGLLDVSATPFVPIAAVVAAAVGEDLEVTAAASVTTVVGAQEVTATMADWWHGDGWRPPAISAPAAAAVAEDPTRGHGLFFSLGVDSWASLLGLLTERNPPRPEADTNGRDRPRPGLSHLLAVAGIDRPRQPGAQAEILATIRRVATHHQLPLIELGTDARDLLDPIDVWDRTHGAVLAGLGLLLGPLLQTVTIAGSHSDTDRPHWGSHIDLDHRWGSETTAIVHHLGSTERVDKVATVAADELARQTLLVCWESGEASNCGHCPKCLRTMTALQLAGALADCPTFPSIVDPDLVRASRRDSTGFVRELVARLPPGELRAAWLSHCEPSLGRRWLPAPDGPPLAGLSARARVSLALAGSGWDADHRPPEETAEAGDLGGADSLELGWEAGMVPLRPSRTSHRDIAAAIADHRSRPLPWVIADHADPRRQNDAGPAALADEAERAWGPGACYLAGIGWGDGARPVLDPAAVGRLLDAGRVRVWWQATGTLDPLRLVESIEHGCLPVQVMPPAEAAALAVRLPAALAASVVDLAGLAEFDVSPRATGDRLAQVADLLLRGSSERDLAIDAAFHPRPPAVAVAVAASEHDG